MNFVELIKDVLVPLLSVFLGVCLAFYFQSRREEKKEEDKQYRAIRFAHFAAMSQYSELISLNDSCLTRYRNRDDAWRQLLPLTQTFASPSLNVSELAFVLEGPDPDLLNRLTVGQQRYDSVKNTIGLRNEDYRQAQRRRATLQAQGNANFGSEEEFRRLIGNDLVQSLKDLTTALFETHESAISLLKENLCAITEFVKKRFPDRKPPEFELIPKDERQ